MIQNLQKTNNITATNIIIVLTVIGYLIQTNISYGSLYMGLNSYFLREDLWWQPLSTMFAHGGIGHLGMNMFVLWQFGNVIERIIGAKRFALMYFICGILTSLFSFLYIYYFDNSVNLVGASGAICAILGYFAYIVKSQRKDIITWILLISVLPILIGLPIAWYSHFIGLAIGFLYGFIRK